jgi:hypothetical protein
MAVQIEDAGFEIRDLIAWVYGSGFPKSLDVSKAIDKLDAKEDQELRRLRFTAWVRGTGVSSREINEATGTNMGGHYTTAASQPAIMTREHLEACRHLLGDVPEWVECEADIRSIESQNFKAREVVGEKTSGLSAGSGNTVGKFTDSRNERGMVNITAPATPGAWQWAGWGTTLKPALEPITVARKPLGGTVAENVLRHGTGAINVNGCRVGDSNGRWPANLIHDGSDEPCALLADAARFFYCAKASKKDRDEGLTLPPQSFVQFQTGNGASGKPSSLSEGRDTQYRNTHPTVKPTELMRYLCRLVTPPGGVVLDPFMGSGSTGKAAALEGFRFIGIEREAEYLEIARGRIEVPAQGSLL